MTTARERLGLLIGALIAILAFVTVATFALRPADRPSELARAGLAPRDADTQPGLDANEEQEEQAESVRERTEAWEAARRAGTAGQTSPRPT